VGHNARKMFSAPQHNARKMFSAPQASEALSP